jgi:hypothetical protein
VEKDERTEPREFTVAVHDNSGKLTVKEAPQKAAEKPEPAPQDTPQATPQAAPQAQQKP